MKGNIVYDVIKSFLLTEVTRYFVVKDVASIITENGIKNQPALHVDVLTANITESIKAKEDQEVASYS